MDMPLNIINSARVKTALEEITLKEDDIFINHHSSPAWLNGVPDIV